MESWAEMVSKILSKSIKNLYFCSWASFGETLARFGTNLVSFRYLLDDLGLRFSCFSIWLLTHQTRPLVLSFNMENDQGIKAHLLRWFPAILEKYMIFGLAFFASVFRLFTHQARHLVSSFNMENDQRIKAHLLRWLPAILKKHMMFGLPFLLQYFDCLPTKLDTWCCHSIWKMISASRRVFWDGFQPFFKNTWFTVLFFYLRYFD